MQTAHAALNPAAGWFADPQVPNLLRWWDGWQWTHHVHPAQPPQAPAITPAVANGFAAAPHSDVVNGFTASPAAAIGAAAHAGPSATAVHAGSSAAHGGSAFHAHAAYGGQPVAATSSSTGTSALGTTPAAEPSLTEANPKSFTAIIVSALYLALAISTGVVLAGIVPAIYTFQAFSKRERLAPVALLAAAAAIGFAFTHMQAQ